MSKQDGRMLTCDRCGATVFVKKIGEKESDGGWTKWDVFEKAEGWTYGFTNERPGELCAECSKLWEMLKKDFFANVEGN